MRYHADASRFVSVKRACRVNVHVHTLKASKAKGLCQLVSSNDPQSCTLASTRDRVERSLARRNRIKSGIAMRFETPASLLISSIFEKTVEKRAPAVNICMNDPSVEANFLNKRAPMPPLPLSVSHSPRCGRHNPLNPRRNATAEKEEEEVEEEKRNGARSKNLARLLFRNSWRATK